MKNDFNLSLWFIFRLVTFKFPKSFHYKILLIQIRVVLQSDLRKLPQDSGIQDQTNFLFDHSNITTPIFLIVLIYASSFPLRQRSLAHRCPPPLPIGRQLEADSCRPQARRQCRNQHRGCFLQAPPIRQKLKTADTYCSKAQYPSILNSHVICIVIFLVVPFCVDMRSLARANKSNDVKSFSRSRYGY